MVSGETIIIIYNKIWISWYFISFSICDSNDFQTTDWLPAGFTGIYSCNFYLPLPNNSMWQTYFKKQFSRQQQHVVRMQAVS